MNKPEITEADLQAHVDGQLPATSHTAVEAYLRDHPQDAERLGDYRRQNKSLHSAYDATLDEAVPAHLAAAVRGRKLRVPVLRFAAVLAWIVLGGLAGWQLRGMQGLYGSESGRGIPSFARQAVIAHAVYTPEVRHPVEVGADQEAHLVAWLSKRIGMPLRVPQLTELGYSLVGGRLLPGLPDDRAPIAQFMYQDAKGLRLTLYVRADADQSRETAFRFAREKNIGVFYWVDQKLGYALSGDIEKNELLRVANMVYRQLNP
jgi:anti-sigma factor RsiW